MKTARAAADRGFFEQVYAVVRSIPRAQVMTYGEIALILGRPRGARAVGWAMRALAGRRSARVPWYRVLARGGVISLPGLAGERQRRALRAEGVRLVGGRVDMTRHSALRLGREDGPGPRRKAGRK